MLYEIILPSTEVRVGCVAILHNGVIVPGVFTEKQYNCALCNLALEKNYWYELRSVGVFVLSVGQAL